MVLFQLICGSDFHPYLTASEMYDKSLDLGDLYTKIMLASHVAWSPDAKTHLSLQFRRLVEGFLRRASNFGLPEVGGM